MRFPSRQSLCVLASILCVFLPRRLAAADFPQAESDLRPAQGARFGQLSNGLGYVILPNHEPEDRASLRLVVAAGSLNESEDQRGLAHFLSHLAFRGSDHYPPGVLATTLKRWGMSGDPEDASRTDYEHTDYLLELPDTRAGTLKEGCRILADIAGGLTLRDDQIDAERPVIADQLAQATSQATADQAAEMAFTLPDTLIPRRNPIGTAAVINAVRRDRLASFYDAWYRPGRIVVVAVGDFDASTIEDMVHDAFGDLKDRAPAPPEPKLGDIAISGGLRTLFIAEPGARGVRISIETVIPYYHEADTAEKRQANLRRGLAFAMLNRRLAALAQQPGAPFVTATADVGEQFDFVHNASVQVICAPGRWKEALAAGEQELRRALTHGFQPAELAEITGGLRRQLQHAADAAPSRPSGRLADAIVRSLEQGQVFTSPAQNLAIYGPVLDSVTPAECAAAFRDAWAARGTCLVVAGDLSMKDPDREIAAAFQASRAVAVQAPPQVELEAFPYSDFGPAGAVASRTEVRDLGITEVVFRNGVRLNLKATKFEPGKIYVNVRVGGGGLTEPADAEPGLARFTEGVLPAAGLGKLSVADIRRVLAGRTVGFQFHVIDDAFEFTGASDRLDFPLELQLITAYITDPGYRPEALEKAHRAIPVMYQRLREVPDTVLETAIARVMANGDPRFGLPAEQELMARNLDEMRLWLVPQFSRGAIEVAMAGDLDVEACIRAVAATLGALPQREPKPPYAAERIVSFPPKPVIRVYPAAANARWGSILFVWPTTDGRDPQVAHRLGLLASIFSSRIRAKIHDAAGAPPAAARSNPSTAYAGYGTIIVDASTSPADPVSNTRAIIAIASELQRNGVLDNEVDRAKQAALSAIDESARTNDYWLNSVLSDAQEEPQRLDWARRRYDDVNSITAADLSDLANRYLDPARASRFIVLPEQAGQ